MITRRNRASKLAGTGRGRVWHGQHTENPNWLAGENWVECQRCGLDYRQRHIKKQWDGLIVCESCWEPRHPQDFVRGRHDHIAAFGHTHPAALTTETAAAGSTNPPLGTFICCDFVIGTIPDQSDSSGATISTITGAVFPTLVNTWNLGSDDNVSTYVLAGAPLTITINATTGDITGTLDNDSEGTYSNVQVEATYESGTVLTTTFNWVVTDDTLGPEAIFGGPLVWWDFTDADTMWTDDDKLVNVASDGDRLRKITNKGLAAPFGGGTAGADGDTSDTAQRPFYRVAVNGARHNACEFIVGASKTGMENDTVGGHLSDGQLATIACVVELPAVATEEHACWGSTNGNEITSFFRSTSGGGNYVFVSRRNSVTDVDESTLVLNTGDFTTGSWWLHIMTIDKNDGTSNCKTYWNNARDDSYLQLHPSGALSIASIVVGHSSAPGSGNDAALWEAHIGDWFMWDGVMGADDQTLLFTWAQRKYALTGTI